MKGRIDEYTIIKDVGAGSYAVVYLVEHPTSKQRHAVKVFKKGDGATMAALQLEFKILQTLNTIAGGHPNILGVINCRQESVLEIGKCQDNRITMVMEYIQGENLFTIMNKKRAPLVPRLARTYFRMLLDGLQFIHNNGICHLDVKLDNTMLAQDGSIKLVDFGLSLFYNNQTNILQPRGSPHYQAPEVRQGNYNGPKADIYSAGIFLFIMTVYQYPFGSRDTKQIPAEYSQFMKDKTAFWSKFKKYMHCDPHQEEFKQLIEGMLVQYAEQRLAIYEIRSSPWYLKTEEASPAELKAFYNELVGEPMEIEACAGEEGARGGASEQLLEKYLADIKVDDSKFFEVAELQPTSVVLDDTPRNFVARLMASLLESKEILRDVEYQKFGVKLSETEPVVDISVDYCDGESKGTSHMRIGMAYDKEQRLVIDFRTVEEDGMSLEDFGVVREHIITSLKGRAEGD